MYVFPDDSPPEYQAIAQLVNSGLDTKWLMRAAVTFHAQSLQKEKCECGDLLVQSGLFQGARLYPISTASQLLPKIQGTYEKEVQDFLSKVSFMFDRFLDVGCAEGFYLAGVARWRQIPCMGIDVDPRARAAFEYLSAIPELCLEITYSLMVDFNVS